MQHTTLTQTTFGTAKLVDQDLTKFWTTKTDEQIDAQIDNLNTLIITLTQKLEEGGYWCKEDEMWIELSAKGKAKTTEKLNAKIGEINELEDILFSRKMAKAKSISPAKAFLAEIFCQKPEIQFYV